MAKRVAEITLGIDTGKDSLDVYEWETDRAERLSNDGDAIEPFLRGLPGPARIAVEATSNYHLAVVDAAVKHGHRVYLINPRQLVHYREAVNVRHKSDALDAWLLARFLAHEAASLRPFEPRSARAQELWSLLKRRAVVVEARKQLEQSFREVRLSCRALYRHFAQLLARIDQRLKQLLRALGWWNDYQRCQTIPGIGPLTATALVAVYHRGAFAGSDAFVSFIGFDIRRRDSGKYQGQRKLSKRGEAEVRRLLFCAAQAARSYPAYERFFQQQLTNGLANTAAKVALGRKLARVAFTLLNRKQLFKTNEIAA